MAKNHTERKWLLRFLGLSCLHPSQVQEAVRILEDQMPPGNTFTTFLKYVKETYTASNARFPATVWASVPSMEPATTNGAESFHSDFNAQFNCAHPNIFSSISILLQVQAQTFLKINSVRKHEQNYIRPKKIELKERRVKAWDELFTGERSISSYLLYMGSLNAKINGKNN
ncbi:hypothetical protein FOCC_FOCC002080 [Frankliniella occidentalis]|nr:hypothetical protein FOCC_FOCC002080 [Frankliniella occidentalis]